MLLTAADLRALPLASAFVDVAGCVVAHTPEWTGAGPGCVAYPVRGKRLLVATQPADATAGALLSEILATLDAAAAAATGDRASRVRILAASLRLLSGQDVRKSGSAAQILELARSGIAARSTLRVDSNVSDGEPLASPEVVALVLVQLAVNAQVHGGATAVHLAYKDKVFRVTWSGARGVRALSTARRHRARERWGMGFARIAADALGGTVYPPRRVDDQSVESTFELGISRLALPLCAVRGPRVLRANQAWEEETQLLPHDLVLASDRLERAVAAAAARPGEIVALDGWSARCADALTWVAVPPDDVADRMRDVVDGMAHERALIDGLPPTTQATLRALALSLGARLGRPVPRMPAPAWRRRMLSLAPQLDAAIDVPAFEGIGALDADVAAVLAARVGGRFEVNDDAMWLRVDDACADDPMLRAIYPDKVTRVRVG